MASQVTINVCTDSLEESNSPDTDIFYANKQTVQKIKDVAKEANVKMDKPVFMENVWRFKNDELKEKGKNYVKNFVLSTEWFRKNLKFWKNT